MGAHGDDFVGKRVETALGARARQQVVVAELGLKALANDDLRSLMDEAVVRVARTLGVETPRSSRSFPAVRSCSCGLASAGGKGSSGAPRRTPAAAPRPGTPSSRTSRS
jgi:hypothetical protein